jgi:hypothetical protein
LPLVLLILHKQMYAEFMTDAKFTQLKIREDRPTGIAGPSHGANIAALGFNVAFIALRNPKLAVEIMKLYDEAHKIQEDDPEAPEEDYALYAEEVRKSWSETSDDES